MRMRPRSQGFAPVVLGLSLALANAGCDDELALRNGRPRVTWVALERVPDGDPVCPFRSCSRVTLWVADIEGDAVDVAARWTAGATSGELTLAPGSYPLSGLMTRTEIANANGVPHMVLWDLAGVPAGTVTLELTVDDRPYDGAAGDTYTTPQVDPQLDVSPVELHRL